MSDSGAVVREFLSLLEAGRAGEAVGLLAPDAQWRNSGLPTLRGPRVRSTLLQMERRNVRFRADLHHVATEGDAVLTDRTDYLRIGRWEASFWVCGTFRVRDGRIELWDDHYAMGNVLAGSVKGLVNLIRGRR
jgi:limonene-1,2-epoxide hydrolase